MGRIIAIANQKGGVGKTTTASAMIAGLSHRGHKVLGVDLDPQGNLSASLGAELYNTPTVYHLLKGDAKVESAIQQIGAMHLIASNIMLASAEQELSATGKEYRLQESLSPIVDNYDFIIIDTPPSLGILTVNAFTFAKEIIIPATPGIFAVDGIKELNRTVLNVRKYCNPNLSVSAILLTKYNNRITINKQIRELTEQLGEYINAPVMNTFIRHGVVVEESQANHVDLFTYSGKSKVAEDYGHFIDEYLRSDKNG